VVMGTRKRHRETEAAPPDGTAASPALDFAGAERAAVIARLFDGVLRSARSHLVRAAEPLAAEVWASGLLAVWDGLPGEGDATAVFGEALIRHAQALGTAEAMAVLTALAAVAEPRLATRARTAVAELEHNGVPAPAWAGQVGTAVPTEAWIGVDGYGDQEILIVGFAYPEDGSEHSICVLVDHTAGGVAKEAYPAAALGTTLARWREVESDGITLRPVELAEAAARLEDALLATDHRVPGSGEAPGQERGDRLAEVRALLGARLEAMPPGEGPGRPELDHDTRERLVADFLGSPEATGLLAEPATVELCHRLIGYRCDFGDGDPIRWSPTLAGRCLLEHFPARVRLDEHDVALVPDVLAAWVRHAGRVRGLPEEAIARILDVVDECRAGFTVAMLDAAGPAGDQRLVPTTH
jgi:hypothetical protein